MKGTWQKAGHAFYVRPMPRPRIRRVMRRCDDAYETTVERNHRSVVVIHRWFVLSVASAWLKAWGLR